MHSVSADAGSIAPTWPVLPRAWAQLLVASELRGMARDIVAQIRTEIPAYRRSLDGPLTRQTRLAVERALQSFFQQVCEHSAAGDQHDQLFRALGRTEAQAGRSLDCLQAAYRIGLMAAWRRVMVVNERMPLPADTVAQLAAAVFGYVDHLAALSVQGHQQAMLGRSEHVHRLRARLLQMLLDQPSTPMEAIQELAAQIGWALPERVVVIDIRNGELLPDPLGELFGPAALAGVESPPPTVLVPAPLDPAVLGRLQQDAGGARLSVGCAVPLTQARQSLQWAQLAARLRGASVLPDRALTLCEDELPTLLLAANPLAVELLVQRRLGPLLALSLQKRWKFARLLSTWLERGGSQAEIADVLGLHRQTVHYQFTRLHDMFGAGLHDPSVRVELLLALRSVLPAWERVAGAA